MLLLFVFLGFKGVEAQTSYTHRALITHNDTVKGAFVYDSLLYTEQWDTLAQAAFWKRVMALPPDSSVVNVAATRQILDVIPRERKPV